MKHVQPLHGADPLSVTMQEKIDDLREWARERTVPAGEDFTNE